VFILIFILATLIGCDNSSNEGGSDNIEVISNNIISQQRYEFSSQNFPFPSLPAGYGDVQNITLVHDVLYFTALSIEANSSIYTPTIFKMKIDGTGLEMFNKYTTRTLPSNVAGGGVSADALYIDNNGYIWIVEAENFFVLESTVNNNLEENVENGYTIRELDRTYRVIKLDNNGFQHLSFEITTDHSWFNISVFLVDCDGNIFIGTNVDNATRIYVFNDDGTVRFSLNVPTLFGELVKTSEGSVSFVWWRDINRVMQTIDIYNESWGETINLPTNARRVFSGNENFLIMFSDDVGIFAICDDTREVERILSFIESGIFIEEISYISVLSNEQIVVVTLQEQGHYEGVELVVFTREDSNISTTSDRIPITLGTLWLTPEIQRAVLQFNNTSTTHFIQVIDYFAYSELGDTAAALDRLSTDIAVGRVPDILHLVHIPFEIYANRGMFIDLYPLLYADIELDCDELFFSVLEAAKTDGTLYRMPIEFSISSIIGHPSVVGTSPGWNMHEFSAVIEENPQADFPLGVRNSKLGFLEFVFFHNMNEYINRISGTAYFDTDDFITLLELADTFPLEIDMELAMADLATNEMIATGRQIMVGSDVGDFDMFHAFVDRFGGEVIFKGWPTESREGNLFRIRDSFAITTSATETEGAWEFLKMMLTEDFQRELSSWTFPVNRTVFNERLEDAMTPPSNMPDPENVLLREHADQLLMLIDSITGTTGHGESDMLWYIVSETALDFFNGRFSAPDAARIIQSRVQRYIDERR